MLFNTWFGQMRWQPAQAVSSEYRWMHRPKRPIGRIQLRSLEPEGGKGKRLNKEYVADRLGNMEVLAHEHIEDFIALGWPIYNGLFVEDTSVTDMLWPDNPEYNRRVLEGLSKQRG